MKMRQRCLSPLSSSAPQSAVDTAVQTLAMSSSVVGVFRLARRVADREAFRGEVSGMRFVKYFPGSRAFHLYSSLVEPCDISGISQSETSWHFQLRHSRRRRKTFAFIEVLTVPSMDLFLYETLLWNSTVDSSVEFLYGTPLWNSSMELLYGIPQ